MSEPETATVEIQVHLVRPDGGEREYRLPEGATLADLLRRSGASTTNQAVLVDGVLLEEALPLHDGAVVTIIPQTGNVTGDEPWHLTIPAFQDEALFQEYNEALKARRRSDDPAEGPTA